MVRAAIALLCTYLALKLFQFFFGGRPGFRDVEPSFVDKLRQGEPVLFAVAFGLSVPLVLWSNWYTYRSSTRALEYSTDCYGRLRALSELPQVQAKFDPYDIFEAGVGAESIAVDSGQWLKMNPALVTKGLADKMRLYKHRYANLARQGSRLDIRDETEALKRCVRPNSS